MKVSELRPGASRVDIKVRVLKLGEEKTLNSRSGGTLRLVEAEVGDTTGTVILNLWQESIGMVNEGDVVDIKNGYVTSFRGEMKLNVGKYGKMTVIDDPTFPSVAQIRSRKTSI